MEKHWEHLEKYLKSSKNSYLKSTRKFKINYMKMYKKVLREFQEIHRRSREII